MIGVGYTRLTSPIQDSGRGNCAVELEVSQPPLLSQSPGRSQAKWVAEQLVLKASREFDLPASIYRFGRPLGHPSSGTSLQGSVPLDLIMENLARLGAAPRSLLDMKVGASFWSIYVTY